VSDVRVESGRILPAAWLGALVYSRLDGGAQVHQAWNVPPVRRYRQLCVGPADRRQYWRRQHVLGQTDAPHWCEVVRLRCSMYRIGDSLRLAGVDGSEVFALAAYTPLGVVFRCVPRLRGLADRLRSSATLRLRQVGRLGRWTVPASRGDVFGVPTTPLGVVTEPRRAVERCDGLHAYDVGQDIAVWSEKRTRAARTRIALGAVSDSAHRDRREVLEWSVSAISRVACAHCSGAGSVAVGSSMAGDIALLCPA